MKNRVLRPAGAWEGPGSAQNNSIKVYVWSEVIRWTFFGVSLRAAAAFSRPELIPKVLKSQNKSVSYWRDSRNCLLFCYVFSRPEPGKQPRRAPNSTTNAKLRSPGGGRNLTKSHKKGKHYFCCDPRESWKDALSARCLSSSMSSFRSCAAAKILSRWASALIVRTFSWSFYSNFSRRT